ncbi:MAG: GNAT family N-acetyltransferase [Fusobacteriota bacterium]
MEYKIKKLEPEDNKKIEKVIRDCLIEYGADQDGFAWSDPELEKLSSAYTGEDERYWVVKKGDKILGGVGIKGINLDGVCELQKMYLLREARGKGIAGKLLNKALKFAEKHYKTCYLETLENMKRANSFYKKHGFEELGKPLLKTEHYGCDRWYKLELK